MDDYEREWRAAKAEQVRRDDTANTERDNIWAVRRSLTEKILMLALTEWKRQNGTADPGKEWLAWAAGCSAQTIRRTLSNLRSDGLIVPVAHLVGGRGRTTEYVLHLEGG